MWQCLILLYRIILTSLTEKHSQFFSLLSLQKSHNLKKLWQCNCSERDRSAFFKEYIFSDFRNTSKPIQVKNQLLENFQSIFKFLYSSQVVDINYTNQQRTALQNITVNQTFGSFHKIAVSHWSDPGVDLSPTCDLKAGLELFVVLLKQRGIYKVSWFTIDLKFVFTVQLYVLFESQPYYVA